MGTMNIHYTIVINRMKEKTRVQMGKNSESFSKRRKERRKERKKTHTSLRQYYLSKGLWGGNFDLR